MQGTTRVYRMKSSQRIASLAVLSGGVFFWVAIWGAVLTERRDGKFLEMMSPIIITLVAALFTIRAFRNAICLSESSIELRSFSGTRSLPFDKIKGRRRYLARGDEDSPDEWHLVLETDDDRYPELDIEELYQFDDFFYAWLSALPDLDEIERNRSPIPV
jgi:hypothetical protein